MESIKDKYQRYREVAKDGDFVLVKNPAFIGKTISYCDKAYWTHLFNVKWETFAEMRRLFVIEEGFEGAGAAFVSSRMKLYSDMAVFRPKRSVEVIGHALYEMVNLAEAGIDYNYKGGVAGLIERFCKNRLGIPVKLNVNTGTAKDCSEWGQVVAAKMQIHDYNDVPRMFPQDFIRFMNSENFERIL